jgi:hypothetical protein
MLCLIDVLFVVAIWVSVVSTPPAHRAHARRACVPEYNGYKRLQNRKIFFACGGLEIRIPNPKLLLGARPKLRITLSTGGTYGGDARMPCGMVLLV